MDLHEEDKDHLKNAEQTLQTIEFKEPYFEKRKHDLILSILECKINGTNKGIMKKILSPIKGFTRYMNRYIMMQPNIMGLGVNFNKAIEDFQKEHNRQV